MTERLFNSKGLASAEAAVKMTSVLPVTNRAICCPYHRGLLRDENGSGENPRNKKCLYRVTDVLELVGKQSQNIPFCEEKRF